MMNAAAGVTLYDAPPEAAIAAVSDYDGPVLVDLDETLYLRNSTEDFIDSARPGLPALVVLRLLDLVAPWRWTGGEPSRDVWRVRTIMLLFPWTIAVWRRRVVKLAACHGNRPLLAALKRRDTPMIVVTVGFEAIVMPLLAALDLAEIRLVATRLSTFDDRRHGKLRLALDALGRETVRRALVLTDSAQDLPLLDTCQQPMRTVWPDARYRHALRSTYLPGQYLSLIKRPGERYIRRAILHDDFALWVLCSIALATAPLWHVAGLACLLLSFWCVYELGYVDNDRIAERYEEQPKLSAAFHRSDANPPYWQAWIWAAATGAIGVYLLRGAGHIAAMVGLGWACLLLLTWLCFLLYNRVDKTSRVWLYIGLQFARIAALVVVVPISVIGMVALSAHILARWMPYYLYRFAGKGWPGMPFRMIRLLFFVVLAALLALAQGIDAVLNWSALALLIWNIWRARDEVAVAWSQAHRLDRDHV